MKGGCRVGDVGLTRKPLLTGVFRAVERVGPGNRVKSGFFLVREVDEGLKKL